MTELTIGIVQMCSGPKGAENVAQAAIYAREAAKQGARLIVLPESLTVIGWPKLVDSYQETIPGPTTEIFSELCKELDVYIVAGSLVEQNPDGGLPYNTSVVIDPAGEIIGKYRKIHLFHVDGDEFVTKETDVYAPGDQLAVVPTPFGKIGLAICNDLRFPELFRLLGKAGADLVCVPSGFTAYTGRYHWEALVKSRAIENQFFIIAPNQVGENSPEYSCFGHSCIIDPWGVELFSAGFDTGAFTITIDLGAADRVRERQSLLRQGKPGLYARLARQVE